MSIAGLSGSLLSHDALAGDPASSGGTERDPARNRREARRWYLSVREQMGPAHPARAVFDRVAAPLAERLGFTVVCSGAGGPSGREQPARLDVDGSPAAVLVALPWGEDLGGGWRAAVRLGLAWSVRWAYCVNGVALRTVDVQRAYSRRYAEFDLASTVEDDQAFCLLWRVLRAPAGGAEPPLDRLVRLSDRHRVEVRASLQHGVREALAELATAFRAGRGAARAGAAAALDESLIVIYRILFLLFAEARGLVPKWHPIYRDHYTIEALREPVESGRRVGGLWESLQAIARLAHRGCRAGTLRVTPFNGSLFSPARAPLAETTALDDGVVRRALLAVTTRAGKERRERISYADLGVEQLGGVYENLLDDDLAAPRDRSPEAGGRRKATGSFYTPRSLTEYLVRRTLAPLVEQASPAAILALRILDPAMGSGAFLVAACRYLADRYERSLVREGAVSPGDVGEDERAAFRRVVAQRCLFGVDINPMAVQLGRLSLWLTTLASDRPLTFLDHNLRVGNSLAGASIPDIVRQPAPGRRGRRRPADLPLFDLGDLEGAVGATVQPRVSIATEPGDTIEQVRRKEALLTALQRSAPLSRWKAAADLWCATWFGSRRGPKRRQEFGALLDAVLERPSALTPGLARPLLEEAAQIAQRERFFHWRLEFPEAFYDEAGRPLERGGFDAIIGNPPWEMLRREGGTGASADERAALVAFARGSGSYPLQGAGHANLYQLFLERALSLVKPSGRLGMVLPAGLALDHGSRDLRRHLLEHTTIDSLVGFDNREGIFPIHRGLRFHLLTLTADGETTRLPLRAGMTSPDVLDTLPDVEPDPSAIPVSRALIVRVSGSQLAIPEIRSEADLRVVSTLVFRFPALGDADGWNLHFGRELNATDDRPHFVDARRGLPVIEGKQLEPFLVRAGEAPFGIMPATAARLMGGEGRHTRPRLGYRDVASAGNRMTLIAAVIPAGIVTTHTIFCSREAEDEDLLHFLCGIFNSFVGNYLVRLRVGTHVTTGIVDRLPVPRLAREDGRFQRIAQLSRRLAGGRRMADRAAIEGEVARVYGLDREALAHVLGTFPLVPASERAAALAAFPV